MENEEAEAKVLCAIARRLFSESREMFREAHEKGMASFYAPTLEEHLRVLDESIAQEGRALKKQSEAVELKLRAFDLRAKMWARLCTKMWA